MHYAVMGKRLQITLAVVLVVLAGVILWLALREPEPIYQGKPLTSWLTERIYGQMDEYGPEPADPARDAIRAIGTNALPVLLKMLHTKDSPLKGKLIERLNAHSVHPVFNTAENYHRMVRFGFFALGPLGKSAVPALIDSLNDTDEDVRLSAVDCLGSIGPNAHAAVPVLTRFINDTNLLVRRDTIINLERIHMNGPVVVPILITNLSKSNPFLRHVIDCLAQFGTQAESAAPVLVQFLSSENYYVREATTNALQQIDPIAAAKAGVK
jgi:HEAT repeat protein